MLIDYSEKKYKHVAQFFFFLVATFIIFSFIFLFFYNSKRNKQKTKKNKEFSIAFLLVTHFVVLTIVDNNDGKQGKMKMF